MSKIKLTEMNLFHTHNNIMIDEVKRNATIFVTGNSSLITKLWIFMLEIKYSFKFVYGTYSFIKLQCCEPLLPNMILFCIVAGS